MIYALVFQPVGRIANEPWPHHSPMRPSRREAFRGCLERLPIISAFPMSDPKLRDAAVRSRFADGSIL